MPAAHWSQQAGGIGIDVQRALGLRPQIGGGAVRGDGAVQGAFGGLGFALLRTEADHLLRAAQGRDGEGERVEGHLVHAREVTFVHLLLTAGQVELDDLHQTLVLEVGDRRIVEGDVAILTDAEAAEVDFLCVQEGGVAFAFRNGLKAIAFEVVEGFRLEAGFDAFAHVAAEAGFVLGIDAEVFIHVEEGDLGPVHAAEADDFFEKFDLGIAGGQNGGSRAFLGDDSGEVITDFQGGISSHVRLVRVKADRQGIHSERLDWLWHELFTFASVSRFQSGRGIDAKKGLAFIHFA